MRARRQRALPTRRREQGAAHERRTGVGPKVLQRTRRRMARYDQRQHQKRYRGGFQNTLKSRAERTQSAEPDQRKRRAGEDLVDPQVGFRRDPCAGRDPQCRHSESQDRKPQQSARTEQTHDQCRREIEVDLDAETPERRRQLREVGVVIIQGIRQMVNVIIEAFVLKRQIGHHRDGRQWQDACATTDQEGGNRRVAVERGRDQEAGEREEKRHSHWPGAFIEPPARGAERQQMTREHQNNTDGTPTVQNLQASTVARRRGCRVLVRMRDGHRAIPKNVRCAKRTQRRVGSTTLT